MILVYFFCSFFSVDSNFDSILPFLTDISRVSLVFLSTCAMTWSGNWSIGAGQFSGTPRHRAASRRGADFAPYRAHARGPDARRGLDTCLPSSSALLLKGERCGVAAPRITAPHYPSTHSHSQAARVRMRRGPRIFRPRIGQPVLSLFLFPRRCGGSQPRPVTDGRVTGSSRKSPREILGPIKSLII